MSEHVLLELERPGQDFLWFRVDVQSGQILACGPFQAWCWVGGYIRPETRDGEAAFGSDEPWQPGGSIVFRATGRTLDYPIHAVSRHHGDVDAAILRQLTEHDDGPMPITGQADMREIKRLERQNLVHWSEAPRTPGSRVRGHAGITAAGLDFLHLMTKRNAA